jgi:peptidoglycan/LPS O-acetylase OafA/YrhL
MLYAAGGLLLASGVLWLALHYSVGAGTGELPHPLEAWAMRVHGLAGFVALFMLGVLAAAHVPHGWRISGRLRWAGQRRSGAVLCALGGLLAFSGYLLYYFAPEGVRPALGWAHTIIGVGMALLAASHRRRGG